MPQISIFLLLLLSGSAALIYQVVWVRILGLSIGSTSVSVSIVIATFFIGMAIGSELSTRIKPIRNNYFNYYRLAEAIIAISALALLPILFNLDRLVISVPLLGQYFVSKLILVTLVLIIPTVCIGASFPLLINALAKEFEQNIKNHSTSKIGLYYGINTLGAVLGAISVGFILIPQWGLDGAVYVAASLNVGALIVATYSKKYWIGIPQHSATDNLNIINQADRQNSPALIFSEASTPRMTNMLLIIVFLTGLVSLSCEVTWTKYFSIYTNTTIYGFSAILAIFLAGISIGAILLNQFLNRITNPIVFLMISLLVLAIVLIASRAGLEYFPSLIGTSKADSDIYKYVLISFFIAPPTILFGVIFSFCLVLLCGGQHAQSNYLGRVYAINTLGSIIGVVLTGMWIIPTWGSDVALKIGVILISLCPLLLSNHSKPGGALSSVFPIVMGLTIISNFLLPQLSYNKIISASMYYFNVSENYTEPRYIFVKEGRSGVISVSTYDDTTLLLKKDNLTEAAIKDADVFSWGTETLLGLLPYFFVDNPQRAFIVGLGAGTTLSAVAITQLKHVDVVEMDPVVLEASNYMYPKGIAALNDPKVHYYNDDARHRLLLQNETYDVIVSQPSHPWLSGAAHLFTQEYFEIVSASLSDKGVYSQWLNLYNLDATTLKSILKAMYSVFPYGITFKMQQEWGLILLAAKQPLVFNYDKITQKMKDPQITRALRKWNIHHAHDLLPYFSLSREQAYQLSKNSIANTDRNLISEVRLANLTSLPIDDENPFALLNSNFRFDISPYLPKVGAKEKLTDMQNYFSSRGDKYRFALIQEKLDNMP